MAKFKKGATFKYQGFTVVISHDGDQYYTLIEDRFGRVVYNNEGDGGDDLLTTARRNAKSIIEGI